MYKIFVKATSSASFTDVTENVSRDSIRIEENILEKANVAIFALESIGIVKEAQEFKIFDTTFLTDTSSVTLLTVNDLFDKVKKFRVGSDLWLDTGGTNEEKVTILAIDTLSKQLTISTASQTFNINTVIGVKKFAGHLTKVKNKNLHQLTNVVFNISGIDFTKEFNRRNINDSFASKTTKEITDEFVREVVNPGLVTGFTTSLMETGSTFDNVKAAFKSPMELMQRLSDEDGGFAWWIDYDKNIHYKAIGGEIAPFSLTTLSNNFIDLEINTDLNRVKNRQVIVGGFEDSIARVAEFHKGDTAKREWVLKAKFSGLTIAVGTNSSSMTTASVLPDFINEETTADYFSNFEMQSVRAAATTSTLVSADLIRFRYNEKIPINVLDEDLTSIEAIKTLGFGDGVIEGRPIRDKSIDKRSEAEDRARAELLRYSNAIVNASFVTEEQGLHPGQVIRINDSNRNINSDFLIQKVKENIYAGDKSKYQIICASTLLGITELIQKLLKTEEKIQVDENVNIDLLKLVTEKVSLTSSWEREGEGEQLETVSMTSSILIEIQTPPFKWGQDPDLLGWWKLDDDLADTNVIDSSDNENDGTLGGGDNTEDKSVNGIAKKAFNFNGSDDHVDMGDVNDLGTNDFSIVAWFNSNDVGALQTILSKKSDLGSTSAGYGLFIENNRLRTSVSDGVNLLRRSTPAILVNNTWYLAIFTFEYPDTISIYLQGILNQSNQSGNNLTGSTNNSRNLRIGSERGTRRFMNGKVDDCRILKRILTPTEITAIFNNPLFNTNAPQGRYNLAQWGETPTSLVEALVIGGGGGGGQSDNGISNQGGGGGGGGFQFDATHAIFIQEYPVVIGAGGGTGADGADSTFSDITGNGGGRGGQNNAGVNGGCGGGGSSDGGAGVGVGGTGSQGGDGGDGQGSSGAGGGGGATDNGANYSGSNGGNGGNGTANSISGSSVTYAGGGGGGALSGATAGTGGDGGGGNGGSAADGSVGTDNLGGGGGGGGNDGGTRHFGGDGGDGVVVISYPTGAITATGGTITTSGGNTIHTFTSNGTFEVTDIA